jgi:hypothetical protein
LPEPQQIAVFILNWQAKVFTHISCSAAGIKRLTTGPAEFFSCFRRGEKKTSLAI